MVVRYPGLLFVCLLAAACSSSQSVEQQKQRPPSGPQCGHGALDHDAHNCGQCGHDCTQLPGVIAAQVICNQGVCDLSNACPPGHAHCSDNPDDGCEADLSTAATCGSCSTQCSGSSATCAIDGKGGYACAAGCGTASSDCSGQCVDVTSDPKNCGGCGMACPGITNGHATCAASACGLACDSGFMLMSGACVSTTPNGWTPLSSGTSNALYGVWGSTAGDVFIVGDRGSILQAARGGSFSAVMAPRYQMLGVWGSDATHVITVGWDGFEGAVERTQADGSFDGNGFVADSFSAVWGSGPDDIYAVGENGRVERNSSGTTWSRERIGSSNSLWGVWGSAAGDVYAVGDSGTIVHSDGSGTWTPQTSGTRKALAAVWGSSASDIFAVGNGGIILHSDGSGTWTVESSGITDNLDGVSGFGSDVWAVGANGTILHRSGGTWSPETSGVTSELWGVWGSAADGVFAVGDGGVILHR